MQPALPSSGAASSSPSGRRRSSYGSSSSLRRSSVSSRDIHQIQMALARVRPVSTPSVWLLLFFLPSFSFFLLYTIHSHQAQLGQTQKQLLTRWPLLLQFIPPLFDPVSWKIVFVLSSVQILLYEVLPRDLAVVVSSTGDTVRNTNGFASTIVFCLSFLLGAALRVYRGDVVFVHFAGIIGCLSILAMAATLSLYTYYYFTDDHSIDSVHDFFLGVENEPSVLEIDLKHLMRSRITLGFYAVASISAGFYHRAYYGHFSYSITTALVCHIVWILMWMWSEDLQLNGVDARRTNLGWLRFWADLVLYPVLLSSPLLLMAQQKRPMNIFFVFPLAIVAISCTFLNYLATKERVRFRRCRGNMKVARKDPFFITAKYRADNGETVTNLLLGSGYWSSCRHPNYAFELVGMAARTAMAGLPGMASPLPFIFFLLYFLLRIHLDEQRCLIKYGSAWNAHCSRVQWKLFPGVY